MAYFTNLGDPDSHIYTLHLQELAGGAPSALGQFESIQSPAWSADGSRLIFSAGPYSSQQVLAVNVQDGTVQVLTDGSDPDVSTR